jgi:hypothetical protein
MPRPLQPGDLVFWTMSNRTVAGDNGLFIGYTVDKPEMAVFEIDGDPLFIPISDISFTGTGDARRATAIRKKFTKANPGVLKV